MRPKHWLINHIILQLLPFCGLRIWLLWLFGPHDIPIGFWEVFGQKQQPDIGGKVSQLTGHNIQSWFAHACPVLEAMLTALAEVVLYLCEVLGEILLPFFLKVLLVTLQQFGSAAL